MHETQTQHNIGGHRGHGRPVAQSMAFFCQTQGPWCGFCVAISLVGFKKVCEFATGTDWPV